MDCGSSGVLLNPSANRDPASPNPSPSVDSITLPAVASKQSSASPPDAPRPSSTSAASLSATVTQPETPVTSDDDRDIGRERQRNGGESDGDGGEDGPPVSPSLPRGERPSRHDIHPFIQTLIHQQQLQQRLQDQPRQPASAAPSSAGGNAPLHPPHQQEWLRAAALSSLLPFQQHHLLKNFPHGHGNRHGQGPMVNHQQMPQTRIPGQLVAPRLPPRPQQFAPEFVGLVNHFNNSANNPRFSRNPPTMPTNQGFQRQMPFSSSLHLANSCVVCRRPLEPGDGDCLILESLTLTASSMSFSEKLEDIVGFNLGALGKSTDFICKRCMGLISLVDRMELELNAAKEQVVVLFRQGNFGDPHYFHRHRHHEKYENMSREAPRHPSPAREDSGDENLEPTAKRRRDSQPMSSSEGLGKVNGDPGTSVDCNRQRSATAGNEEQKYLPGEADLRAHEGHRFRRQSSFSDSGMLDDRDNELELQNERSNLISGSSDSESDSQEMYDSDTDDEMAAVEGIGEDGGAPSSDAPPQLVDTSKETPAADGIIDLSRSSGSDSKPDITPLPPPHLHSVPPQIPQINCEFCDESFNKSHHYEYHLNKVHLKESPYVCTVCRKNFCSDFALTTHIGRRCHFAAPEDRLLDIGEGQSFFDTATQSVRWKCRQCAHSSKSKTALRFHVALAHVPPRGKYLCRRCGRGFMQASALEAHVNREHLRHQPYPCDDCDKAFFSKTALRSHKSAKQLGPVVARLHAAAAAAREEDTDRTPPPAPTRPDTPIGAASSVFPTMDRMTHPGMNHKFEMTSAHLGSGGTAQAHHQPPSQQPAAPQGGGQAPVIACPLCLMLFPSESSLMQHQRSGCPGSMAMTHINPFAAAVASQHQPRHPHHPHPHHHHHPLLDARPTFPPHHLGMPHHLVHPNPSGGPPPSPASSAAAMMMNQIKSFLCRNCGEAYRTKDALDRHLWLVHSIKAENVVIYRCDECGKEYTKKQRYDTHMMLHRGERPHRCPYCKYDTNIRGNLRLHVKNVHKVELPLMRRKRGQD